MKNLAFRIHSHCRCLSSDVVYLYTQCGGKLTPFNLGYHFQYTYLSADFDFANTENSEDFIILINSWNRIYHNFGIVGGMTPSGKVGLVALVRTNVSEERITSIVRVTTVVKLATLAVTSNRGTLRRSTLSPWWWRWYVPPWKPQILHSINRLFPIAET
jgi:hypothetical protein